MVLVCAATTSVSSPWRREVSSELRALVAAGCRVLGEADQGDLIWGHVSARDPDGRGVWMKASGLGFDEIGPDEVILVGWDGEVLEGDRRRHAEYPIHTEVVRARADVGAVMHTHSRAAVALGALGAPLRPISHEANLFVPPELARFTQTGDLILTARRGTAGAPQPTGTLAAVVDGGLATFGPRGGWGAARSSPCGSAAAPTRARVVAHPTKPPDHLGDAPHHLDADLAGCDRTLRPGAPLDLGEPQPAGDPAAGDVGLIVHDLHPLDVRQRKRLTHQRRHGRGRRATAGPGGMQPVADLQPARSDPAHEPTAANDDVLGGDRVLVAGEGADRRRGIESSSRLGCHRWKAECLIAWLAGCRRLRIRYDRDSERFFAFAMLACARLCYNPIIFAGGTGSGRKARQRVG